MTLLDTLVCEDCEGTVPEGSDVYRHPRSNLLVCSVCLSA